MTSYGVVALVLAIEAVLIAVGVIVVFWHAFSMRASVAARRPNLERGRVILYGGLQRGTLDGAELDELRRFSLGTQIRLFADLAPSLVGDDRDWLGAVAAQCGILDYAYMRSRSALWWRRLNAARLLTLFGRTDATMFRLARDPNPLVRAQAAEAFGLATRSEGIAKLIDLLADEHALVRFMARDSLVRIGRHAHQAIADAIRGGTHPALVPLLSVAATSPSHVFAGAVMPLAADPRPEIRAAVADVLRSIGGADASEALARMLDDPMPLVHLRAIDGLAALGFWPASPAIAKLLDAPDWQVRYRAALALQNLGGPGELLLRRAAERESIGAPIARRVLDAAAQLRLEAAR